MTILIVDGVNFFQTKKSFLAKGKAGIQSVSDVLVNTIKVATNYKAKDETRPIGGYYPKGSPQYKAVTSESPLLFLESSGGVKTLGLLSPFKDALEEKFAGAYG